MASVRFVMRWFPMLGTTETSSFSLDRELATPSFLLGFQAGRASFGLGFNYYMIEGEDYGSGGWFTLLAFGPTVAVRFLDAARGRVQFHGFGSFIFGRARVTVWYEGEDDASATADVFGGSLGLLGRGFLFPMVAVDAGMALDILDFEENDSDDGVTQVQVVGFLGITFVI